MPGLAYRRARDGRSVFRERKQIADELGLSIVNAFVIHCVFFYACLRLSGQTGLTVDIRSAIVLLSGRFGTDDQSFSRAVESVSQYPVAVGSYFLLSIAFGYLCGKVAKYLLRPVRRLCNIARTRLHRYLPNSWIPLDGETDRSALQLSESIDSRDDTLAEPGTRRFGQWLRACELPQEEVDELGGTVELLVEVAAVVELGGTAYLFRGILDKAFFGPDGDLERVSLNDVSRRAIKSDEKGTPTEPEREARFYHVTGNQFVLRLHEAKTVNFQYYAIMPGSAAELSDDFSEN